MGDAWIARFVEESNRIEGLFDVRPQEVEATKVFVALDDVRQSDLEAFVSACQPGAVIRDRVGLNVRVGSHIPPSGGRQIVESLHTLLERANKPAGVYSPWRLHVDYETLHPFTDGNGRSGRVLWLWMMLHLGNRHAVQAMQLGFLHTFYYQTLENRGGRKDA